MKTNLLIAPQSDNEPYQTSMYINDNTNLPKIRPVVERICRNCKHWSNEREQLCMDPIPKAFAHDGDFIITKPTFGCNQFEGK